MGPRVFARGNVTSSSSFGIGVASASMGPRVFARGNARKACRLVPYHQASMGPRVFARGNFGNEVQQCCWHAASMGPRVFARGNSCSSKTPASTCTCFNGAASFCSRKCLRTDERRGRILSASMGPRVFARGNLRCKYGISLVQLLQWGREFLLAEMLAQHARAPRTVAGLQWGREFLLAEISVSAELLRVKLWASMGPRVFARGNATPKRRCGGRRWASMGPRVFARGNSAPARKRRPSPMGFNGAASFCSRKSRHVGRHGKPADASMGPRVFARGNDIKTAETDYDRLLQWGREFLLAEIALLAKPYGIGPQERRFERLCYGVLFSVRLSLETSGNPLGD